MRVRIPLLPLGLLAIASSSSAGQQLQRLPADPECPACTITLRPFVDLDPAGDLRWESTVAALPDGRFVAAPLWEPGRMAEFDASGALLRQIGRAGQGPGEYTSIVGLFASPDDRLFVVDDVLDRISVLDSTLTFSSALPSVRAPAQVAFIGTGTIIVNGESSEALSLTLEPGGRSCLQTGSTRA